MSKSVISWEKNKKEIILCNKNITYNKVNIALGVSLITHNEKVITVGFNPINSIDKNKIKLKKRHNI